MIEEIKHKESNLIVKVVSTQEIRDNGVVSYKIIGFIKADHFMHIKIDLLIPEICMKDFDITYKTFI